MPDLISPFSADCSWRRSRSCGCATRRDMNLHLVLAGLTAIGLLFYLIAVLVRPEKF